MSVIDRAAKAHRILNDELFVDAFESVRQALLNKFEGAPVSDSEGIVKVRLCLKLLHDVRANLERAVQDGKIKEFEIQEQKRTEPKLSDFRVNRH